MDKPYSSGEEMAPFYLWCVANSSLLDGGQDIIVGEKQKTSSGRFG